jgi:hypothetical protein
LLSIQIADAIDPTRVDQVFQARLEDPLEGHKTQEYVQGEEHQSEEIEGLAQARPCAGDPPDEGQRDQAGGDSFQKQTRSPVGLGDGHGASRLPGMVLCGYDRDGLGREVAPRLRCLRGILSDCWLVFHGNRLLDCHDCHVSAQSLRLRLASALSNLTLSSLFWTMY